jgi:hypothetical protein
MLGFMGYHERAAFMGSAIGYKGLDADRSGLTRDMSHNLNAEST